MKIFTKEQEEELERGFWNLVTFGENAYEVYNNGDFRSLTIEEIEKLKKLFEGMA